MTCVSTPPRTQITRENRLPAKNLLSRTQLFCLDILFSTHLFTSLRVLCCFRRVSNAIRPRRGHICIHPVLKSAHDDSSFMYRSFCFVNNRLLVSSISRLLSGCGSKTTFYPFISPIESYPPVTRRTILVSSFALFSRLSNTFISRPVTDTKCTSIDVRLKSLSLRPHRPSRRSLPRALGTVSAPTPCDSVSMTIFWLIVFLRLCRFGRVHFLRCDDTNCAGLRTRTLFKVYVQTIPGAFYFVPGHSTTRCLMVDVCMPMDIWPTGRTFVPLRRISLSESEIFPDLQIERARRASHLVDWTSLFLFLVGGFKKNWPIYIAKGRNETKFKTFCAHGQWWRETPSPNERERV